MEKDTAKALSQACLIKSPLPGCPTWLSERQLEHVKLRLLPDTPWASASRASWVRIFGAGAARGSGKKRGGSAGLGCCSFWRMRLAAEPRPGHGEPSSAPKPGPAARERPAATGSAQSFKI